jgi:hypothetical protein
MEECIPQEGPTKMNGVYTDQAVSVDLQLGIGTYIPWCKAYYIAHTQTSWLT